MNKALSEFLALRQASEAGSVANPGRDGGGLKAEESQVTAVPGETQPLAGARLLEPPDIVSVTGITEQALAAYFVDLLAAHPSGRPVKERASLANYLARGILHRYGDPKQVTWQGETPLRHHKRAKALWVARCPAGHLTDEAIESHQVIGWACERCQRVYDSTECHLVPRGVEKESGGDKTD